MTDEILCYPVLTNLSTMFTGERGSGKSALGTLVEITHMTAPQCNIDMAKCREIVKELRAGGWTHLEIPPHVKHLVYDCKTVVEINGTKSMTIDFKKLGLYDGTCDVETPLPNSFITIDEAQSDADSRKWNDPKKGLSDGFYRMQELARKWSLRLLFITQNYNTIEIRTRSLVERIIHVLNMENFYHPFDFKKKNVKSSIWHCLDFTSASQYEQWLKDKNSVSPRKIRFQYKGNIFSHYDTNAGRERFLDGLVNKNFSCKTAENIGTNKKALLEYRKNNPFVYEKPKKGEKAS
jgi:hypothetical protein